MTELELYSNKLIEALSDSNPLLLLRRVRNNASMAVALAEAHSILTEADKFATNIYVTNKIITSAFESKTQERLLSYMCLKKLSELYTKTYAYKHGFINETCDCVVKFDGLASKKLINLSKYLKTNVKPLICAIRINESRIVKQHIMRQMLAALDRVG